MQNALSCGSLVVFLGLPFTLNSLRTRQSFALYCTVLFLLLAICFVVLWATQAPITWPNGDLVFKMKEIL